MKKFLLILFLTIGSFVFAVEEGMEKNSHKESMNSQEIMQKDSLRKSNKKKRICEFACRSNV